MAGSDLDSGLTFSDFDDFRTYVLKNEDPAIKRFLQIDQFPQVRFDDVTFSTHKRNGRSWGVQFDGKGIMEPVFRNLLRIDTSLETGGFIGFLQLPDSPAPVIHLRKVKTGSGKEVIKMSVVLRLSREQIRAIKAAFKKHAAKGKFKDLSFDAWRQWRNSDFDTAVLELIPAGQNKKAVRPSGPSQPATDTPAPASPVGGGKPAVLGSKVAGRTFGEIVTKEFSEKAGFRPVSSEDVNVREFGLFGLLEDSTASRAVYKNQEGHEEARIIFNGEHDPQGDKKRHFLWAFDSARPKESILKLKVPNRFYTAGPSPQTVEYTVDHTQGVVDLRVVKKRAMVGSAHGADAMREVIFFYVLLPDRTVEAIRQRRQDPLLDFDFSTFSAVPQRLVIVSNTDANQNPSRYPFLREGGQSLSTTVPAGLTAGRVLKGFDEIRAFVREIGPLQLNSQTGASTTSTEALMNHGWMISSGGDGGGAADKLEFAFRLDDPGYSAILALEKGSKTAELVFAGHYLDDKGQAWPPRTWTLEAPVTLEVLNAADKNLRWTFHVKPDPGIPTVSMPTIVMDLTNDKGQKTGDRVSFQPVTSETPQAPPSSPQKGKKAVLGSEPKLIPEKPVVNYREIGKLLKETAGFKRKPAARYPPEDGVIVEEELSKENSIKFYWKDDLEQNNEVSWFTLSDDDVKIGSPLVQEGRYREHGFVHASRDFNAAPKLIGFEGMQIEEIPNAKIRFWLHFQKMDVDPEMRSAIKKESILVDFLEMFFGGKFKNGDEYRIVVANEAETRKKLGLPEGKSGKPATGTLAGKPGAGTSAQGPASLTGDWVTFADSFKEDALMAGKMEGSTTRTILLNDTVLSLMTFGKPFKLEDPQNFFFLLQYSKGRVEFSSIPINGIAGASWARFLFDPKWVKGAWVTKNGMEVFVRLDPKAAAKVRAMLRDVEQEMRDNKMKGPEFKEENSRFVAVFRGFTVTFDCTPTEIAGEDQSRSPKGQSDAGSLTDLEKSKENLSRFYKDLAEQLSSLSQMIGVLRSAQRIHNSQHRDNEVYFGTSGFWDVLETHQDSLATLCMTFGLVSENSKSYATLRVLSKEHQDDLKHGIEVLGKFLTGLEQALPGWRQMEDPKGQIKILSEFVAPGIEKLRDRLQRILDGRETITGNPRVIPTFATPTPEPQTSGSKSDGAKDQTKLVPGIPSSALELTQFLGSKFSQSEALEMLQNAFKGTEHPVEYSGITNSNCAYIWKGSGPLVEILYGGASLEPGKALEIRLLGLRGIDAELKIFADGSNAYLAQQFGSKWVQYKLGDSENFKQVHFVPAEKSESGKMEVYASVEAWTPQMYEILEDFVNANYGEDRTAGYKSHFERIQFSDRGVELVGMSMKLVVRGPENPDLFAELAAQKRSPRLSFGSLSDLNNRAEIFVRELDPLIEGLKRYRDGSKPIVRRNPEGWNVLLLKMFRFTSNADGSFSSSADSSWRHRGGDYAAFLQELKSKANQLQAMLLKRKEREKDDRRLRMKEIRTLVDFLDQHREKLDPVASREFLIQFFDLRTDVSELDPILGQEGAPSPVPSGSNPSPAAPAPEDSKGQSSEQLPRSSAHQSPAAAETKGKLVDGPKQTTSLDFLKPPTAKQDAILLEVFRDWVKRGEAHPEGFIELTDPDTKNFDEAAESVRTEIEALLSRMPGVRKKFVSKLGRFNWDGPKGSIFFSTEKGNTNNAFFPFGNGIQGKDLFFGGFFQEVSEEDGRYDFVLSIPPMVWTLRLAEFRIFAGMSEDGRLRLRFQFAKALPPAMSERFVANGINPAHFEGTNGVIIEIVDPNTRPAPAPGQEVRGKSGKPGANGGNLTDQKQGRTFENIFKNIPSWGRDYRTLPAGPSYSILGRTVSFVNGVQKKTISVSANKEGRKPGFSVSFAMEKNETNFSFKVPGKKPPVIPAGLEGNHLVDVIFREPASAQEMVIVVTDAMMDAIEKADFWVLPPPPKEGAHHDYYRWSGTLGGTSVKFRIVGLGEYRRELAEAGNRTPGSRGPGSGEARNRGRMVRGGGDGGAGNNRVPGRQEILMQVLSVAVNNRGNDYKIALQNVPDGLADAEAVCNITLERRDIETIMGWLKNGTVMAGETIFRLARRARNDQQWQTWIDLTVEAMPAARNRSEVRNQRANQRLQTIDYSLKLKSKNPGISGLWAVGYELASKMRSQHLSISGDLRLGPSKLPFWKGKEKFGRSEVRNVGENLRTDFQFFVTASVVENNDNTKFVMHFPRTAETIRKMTIEQNWVRGPTDASAGIQSMLKEQIISGPPSFIMPPPKIVSGEIIVDIERPEQTGGVIVIDVDNRHENLFAGIPREGNFIVPETGAVGLPYRLKFVDVPVSPESSPDTNAPSDKPDQSQELPQTLTPGLVRVSDFARFGPDHLQGRPGYQPFAVINSEDPEIPMARKWDKEKGVSYTYDPSKRTALFRFQLQNGATLLVDFFQSQEEFVLTFKKGTEDESFSFKIAREFSHFEVSKDKNIPARFVFHFNFRDSSIPRWVHEKGLDLPNLVLSGRTGQPLGDTVSILTGDEGKTKTEPPSATDAPSSKPDEPQGSSQPDQGLVGKTLDDQTFAGLSLFNFHRYVEQTGDAQDKDFFLKLFKWTEPAPAHVYSTDNQLATMIPGQPGWSLWMNNKAYLKLEAQIYRDGFEVDRRQTLLENISPSRLSIRYRKLVGSDQKVRREVFVTLKLSEQQLLAFRQALSEIWNKFGFKTLSDWLVYKDENGNVVRLALDHEEEGQVAPPAKQDEARSSSQGGNPAVTPSAPSSGGPAQSLANPQEVVTDMSPDDLGEQLRESGFVKILAVSGYLYSYVPGGIAPIGSHLEFLINTTNLPSLVSFVAPGTSYDFVFGNDLKDKAAGPYLKQARKVGNTVYILLDTISDEELAMIREIIGSVKFPFSNETVTWKFVTVQEANAEGGYETYKDIFRYAPAHKKESPENADSKQPAPALPPGPVLPPPALSPAVHFSDFETFFRHVNGQGDLKPLDPRMPNMAGILYESPEFEEKQLGSFPMSGSIRLHDQVHVYPEEVGLNLKHDRLGWLVGKFDDPQWKHTGLLLSIGGTKMIKLTGDRPLAERLRIDYLKKEQGTRNFHLRVTVKITDVERKEILRTLKETGSSVKSLEECLRPFITPNGDRIELVLEDAEKGTVLSSENPPGGMLSDLQSFQGLSGLYAHLDKSGKLPGDGTLIEGESFPQNKWQEKVVVNSGMLAALLINRAAVLARLRRRIGWELRRDPDPAGGRDHLVLIAHEISTPSLSIRSLLPGGKGASGDQPLSKLLFNIEALPGREQYVYQSRRVGARDVTDLKVILRIPGDELEKLRKEAGTWASRGIRNLEEWMKPVIFPDGSSVELQIAPEDAGAKQPAPGAGQMTGATDPITDFLEFAGKLKEIAGFKENEAKSQGSARFPPDLFPHVQKPEANAEYSASKLPDFESGDLDRRKGINGRFNFGIHSVEGERSFEHSAQLDQGMTGKVVLKDMKKPRLELLLILKGFKHFRIITKGRTRVYEFYWKNIILDPTKQRTFQYEKITEEQKRLLFSGKLKNGDEYRILAENQEEAFQYYGIPTLASQPGQPAAPAAPAGKPQAPSALTDLAPTVINFGEHLEAYSISQADDGTIAAMKHVDGSLDLWDKNGKNTANISASKIITANPDVMGKEVGFHEIGMVKRMQNAITRDGLILYADAQIQNEIFLLDRNGKLVEDKWKLPGPFINARRLKEQNPAFDTHPAIDKFKPVYVTEGENGSILIISNPTTPSWTDYPQAYALLVLDRSGKLLCPPITGKLLADKNPARPETQDDDRQESIFHMIHLIKIQQIPFGDILVANPGVSKGGVFVMSPDGKMKSSFVSNRMIGGDGLVDSDVALLADGVLMLAGSGKLTFLNYQGDVLESLGKEDIGDGTILKRPAHLFVNQSDNTVLVFDSDRILKFRISALLAHIGKKPAVSQPSQPGLSDRMVDVTEESLRQQVVINGYRFTQDKEPFEYMVEAQKVGAPASEIVDGHETRYRFPKKELKIFQIHGELLAVFTSLIGPDSGVNVAVYLLSSGTHKIIGATGGFKGEESSKSGFWYKVVEDGIVFLDSDDFFLEPDNPDKGKWTHVNLLQPGFPVTKIAPPKTGEPPAGNGSLVDSKWLEQVTDAKVREFYAKWQSPFRSLFNIAQVDDDTAIESSKIRLNHTDAAVGGKPALLYFRKADQKRVLAFLVLQDAGSTTPVSEVTLEMKDVVRVQAMGDGKTLRVLVDKDSKAFKGEMHGYDYQWQAGSIPCYRFYLDIGRPGEFKPGFERLLEIVPENENLNQPSTNASAPASPVGRGKPDSGAKDTDRSVQLSRGITSSYPEMAKRLKAEAGFVNGLNPGIPESEDRELLVKKFGSEGMDLRFNWKESETFDFTGNVKIGERTYTIEINHRGNFKGQKDPKTGYVEIKNAAAPSGTIWYIIDKQFKDFVGMRIEDIPDAAGKKKYIFIWEDVVTTDDQYPRVRDGSKQLFRSGTFTNGDSYEIVVQSEEAKKQEPRTPLPPAGKGQAQVLTSGPGWFDLKPYFDRRDPVPLPGTSATIHSLGGIVYTPTHGYDVPLAFLDRATVPEQGVKGRIFEGSIPGAFPSIAHGASLEFVKSRRSSEGNAPIYLRYSWSYPTPGAMKYEFKGLTWEDVLSVDAIAENLPDHPKRRIRIVLKEFNADVIGELERCFQALLENKSERSLPADVETGFDDQAGIFFVRSGILDFSIVTQSWLERKPEESRAGQSSPQSSPKGAGLSGGAVDLKAIFSREGSIKALRQEFEATLLKNAKTSTEIVDEKLSAEKRMVVRHYGSGEELFSVYPDPMPTADKDRISFYSLLLLGLDLRLGVSPEKGTAWLVKGILAAGDRFPHRYDMNLEAVAEIALTPLSNATGPRHEITIRLENADGIFLGLLDDGLRQTQITASREPGSIVFQNNGTIFRILFPEESEVPDTNAPSGKPTTDAPAPALPTGPMETGSQTLVSRDMDMEVRAAGAAEPSLDRLMAKLGRASGWKELSRGRQELALGKTYFLVSRGVDKISVSTSKLFPPGFFFRVPGISFVVSRKEPLANIHSVLENQKGEPDIVWNSPLKDLLGGKLKVSDQGRVTFEFQFSEDLFDDFEFRAIPDPQGMSGVDRDKIMAREVIDRANKTITIKGTEGDEVRLVFRNGPEVVSAAVEESGGTRETNNQRLARGGDDEVSGVVSEPQPLGQNSSNNYVSRVMFFLRYQAEELQTAGRLRGYDRRFVADMLIEFERENAISLTSGEIRTILERVFDTPIGNPGASFRFAEDRRNFETILTAIQGFMTSSRILNQPNRPNRSELRRASQNSDAATALSELAFAKEQGFVKSYEIKTKASGDFNGVVTVVGDPVKKPGDNLFMHLDTEDILKSWDAAKAAELSPASSPRLGERSRTGVILGEMAFFINGHAVRTLVKPEADGKFSLVVREGLMDSLRDSLKPGQNLAEAFLSPSNESLDRCQGAIHESIAVTNAVANEWIARKRVQEPLSKKKALEPVLLITTDVIRKNYGIARSIGILASLGYRIFVREDASIPSEQVRREFYKAYHLDGLVEGKVLFPVHGEDADIRQQIASITRKRFDARDVMLVGFDGELPQVSGQSIWDTSSKLVLRKDLLGVGRKNRADYPVLLMAARLLETPEEVLKLGAAYITRTEANAWQMNATPEDRDLSRSLTEEIMNYQAIARRFASAA